MELFIYGHSTGDAYRLEHCFSDRLLGPPPRRRILTESRRRPIRLKGYDYSQPGGYFVTIVTQNRLCLFGEVVGEKMHLNEAGIMIREIWKNLPRRFPTVELDVFVVMPNHIHGILQIHEPVGASLVGALDGNPGSEVTAGATDGDRAATRAAPTGVALGGVIGAYKSITTVEYTRGVKSENGGVSAGVCGSATTTSTLSGTRTNWFAPGSTSSTIRFNGHWMEKTRKPLGRQDSRGNSHRGR